MRAIAMLALLGMVAACGRGENENLPTPEESQGLNEAAAMLEAAPDDLNVGAAEVPDEGAVAENSGAEAR